MGSNFFERYKIIILLFLLVACFLLVGYAYLIPLEGSVVPIGAVLALMLVVLVVAAVGGRTSVKTKPYVTDTIVWSSKGLDINQLASILEKYPEIGALVVNEKNEGKLTALYYPTNGGKSKVEMTAEKTPGGTDLKFNYSASIYRNGMEFWIIFFLLCVSIIGVIIALPFFDKRDKENKNLQNSIYQLINYIEQHKK